MSIGLRTALFACSCLYEYQELKDTETVPSKSDLCNQVYSQKLYSVIYDVDKFPQKIPNTVI